MLGKILIRNVMDILSIEVMKHYHGIYWYQFLGHVVRVKVWLESRDYLTDTAMYMHDALAKFVFKLNGFNGYFRNNAYNSGGSAR